ncbi:BTB/POZ domain and ankyrin repeat-containing protein NPR5-like isoform X2 [Lolium rigidum]|uniref:BTB/POZ domain and ankyrin repeat-containing protein NPR5-like isoform X2 n=1 Tax=Lolium rigidum TaxID=89674 RepID=UPI001F5D2E31|nr:BTB/POZ domain and ankyrin repeat-containing protein NPR5-like isoform X2 [Lolium rigidum]
MDDTLKSLSMDYLNLLINGQAFSDVTFSVEGRLVHAHRCILAARSLFFRKFFCGAAADQAAAAAASAAPGALLMDHLSPRSPSGASASSPRGGGTGSAVAPAPGAVIPVNSVSYEVFLLLLQFLYSGQVSLVPQKGEPRPGCGERGCWHTHCAAAVDLALDTLAAARSFGVEELAILTQLAGMVEKASIEDVMKVLLASRKQDLHQLWSTCSHLVAKSGLPPEVLAKHLPLDVVAKIDDLRLKSSMARRSPFLAHHQQHQHQHHQGSVVEASAAELDDHHKIRRMRRALDSSDVELVKLMVMGEGLNLDEALALHYAVENCSREVVKALLELGAADVNHPAGPAGKTPLHVAAEMVCPDMVAVLLDHHADPNVRTVDGVTPLDILRTLTSDFLFKGAVPGLTHIEPNKLRLCLELVQSAAMVMSREDAAGNAAVPMYSEHQHHPGSGGGGVYSGAGGASTSMNLSLDNRMVYLNLGMDVMNHGDDDGGSRSAQGGPSSLFSPHGFP